MAGLIMPAERSIILAGDVPHDEFETLVGDIGAVDGLDGYKIGFQVCLGMGIRPATEIVRSVNESAVVIYDHQKAGTDIPDTAVNFAGVMEYGGVDAAILFPFTGPAVEEAWIKALQDKNIGVIVGAEMTHAQIRASEGGYVADDAFKRMFAQAVNLEVRDFVVPGNKPDKVAEYRGFFDDELGSGNFSLYSPGLISQGGVISEAGLEAGSSFHGIIGRGITQAADRRAAAVEHTQEIKAL